MEELTLKNQRKKFKEQGLFHTPKELAEYMKSFLPNGVREVYDPTCGYGNLLAVFPDDVRKYGQELEEAQMEVCKERLVNFEGYAGDTLTSDHFAGRKFEAIVSNPPYSVKWDQFEDDRWNGPGVLAPKSKADYAFVLHCLSHLADSGKAILMIFPGILYRGNAEGKIRKWLVEQNVIEQVIQCPDKKFTDTSIAVTILVLSKSKTTTDILFRDELDNERVVTFEEIEKENFNLSVSTYVDKPDTREKVDIDEVNKQVADYIVNGLRKNLLSQKVIYDYFHDGDFPSLISRCRQVLDDVENHNFAFLEVNPHADSKR